MIAPLVENLWLEVNSIRALEDESLTFEGAEPLGSSPMAGGVRGRSRAVTGLAGARRSVPRPELEGPGPDQHVEPVLPAQLLPLEQPSGEPGKQG